MLATSVTTAPVITDTACLHEFLDDIRGAPYVTLDTEFMREKTYFAELCLVQIASPEEAAIIDPLARDIDLTPLRQLLLDPDTVKVFHAARQDVEIFYQRLGCIPTPLFDTQLAAMVCGHGDNVGYERLVTALTSGTIDKSSRFVDWARRPLPQRALDYALSDVTWLRDVYAALSSELARNNREDWLSEELAVMTDPATYEQTPESAWQRLKIRSNKPRLLAQLQVVAAWREREAQRRNLPRSWILKDEAVQEIAASEPADRKALEAVRSMNRGAIQGAPGDALLAEVAAVKKLPKDQLPQIEKPEAGPNPGAVAELLKVLLKLRSEELGVAPKVIADMKSLDRLAAGERGDHPVLKGWRLAAFGRDALRLLNGELALAGDGRGLRLLEISQ